MFGSVVLKLLEAKDGELVAEMCFEHLERATELIVILLDGSESNRFDLTGRESYVSD